MEGFYSTLQEDRFLDISSPFEDTLKEVEQLEAKCGVLTEKSKDINEFQKTLDMDVSAFDYVEEARLAMLYRASSGGPCTSGATCLSNDGRQPRLSR